MAYLYGQWHVQNQASYLIFSHRKGAAICCMPASYAEHFIYMMSFHLYNDGRLKLVSLSPVLKGNDKELKEVSKLPKGTWLNEIRGKIWFDSKN